MTTAIRDRVKELRRVPARDLIANPKNWRRHPKAQAAALAGVLAEIGYADALIARETPAGLMLIDGHLRAETTPGALVPVLVLDVDEAEADKILLTLDPLAAMAEADKDNLAALLAAVETQDAGILAMLEGLARDARIALPVNEGLTDPDDVPEAPEPVTQLGDLWLLGGHRVLCGDSTDAAAVARLMDGRRAQVAFTDPPYNVSLGDHGGQQRGQRRRRIENDALPPEQWEAFCRAWARNLLASVDGALYICMSTKEWPVVSRVLEEEGAHWSDTIIWAKDRFVLGRADYQRQYEPLWFGWREGAKHHWCGARDQGDVWTIARPSESDLHPTMKPLALMERALENSSVPGDIVADFFLGSGSTLIAAERTGRVCYGVEVDARYVDVAIARWESFSGLKAERLE